MIDRTQYPRPLSVHMATAVNVWSGAGLGYFSLRNGMMSWEGKLREQGNDIVGRLKESDQEVFLAQMMHQEMQTRMQKTLDGIARYRAHSYRRVVKDAPSVWSEGSSRLLRYKPAKANGQAVFIVPSLINKYTILDLREEQSFVRYLTAHGYDVYMLDWGRPDTQETDFCVEDYIVQRLLPAARYVKERHGQAAIGMGYCMGGTLLIGAACLEAAAFSALIPMAAPWDFHAGRTGIVEKIEAYLQTFAPVMEAGGQLPVDAIQMLFLLLDPMRVPKKFRKFADWADDDGRVQTFVAVEDWVNDGVPLMKGVADNCLRGWFVDNQPVQSQWRLKGQAIKPGTLSHKTLAVMPQRDHLVPPESSKALANSLKHCDVLCPHYGHIGMMIGSGAQDEVWGPVVDWIKQL